jgi:hypothetical protein
VPPHLVASELLTEHDVLVSTGDRVDFVLAGARLVASCYRSNAPSIGVGPAEEPVGDLALRDRRAAPQPECLVGGDLLQTAVNLGVHPAHEE